MEIIAAEPLLGHKIQGLKNMKESIVPEIFDKNAADRIISVYDSDAYETARRLAKEEGLILGMSSGAAMWVALKMTEELDKEVIATIMHDRGEKYLSTALYN